MPPLSQRLRTETQTLHTAAERAGVMRCLLRGELSRRAYVSLLENLGEIYRALELGLAENSAHPALSRLDFKALARHACIEDDLRTLRSAGESPQPIMPATRTYVERLRQAAESAPDLLLAHAYVRYLGDLSGGRILAPIVARHFGADGVSVTRFYEFPLITDIAGFKRAFRDDLDRITGERASDGIVEEAKAAFQLHERLFRELEQPST